ncbi:uncharacterized protein LOC129922560 [Biomphalaria glabrata]|uniref:Uncharacterized protein LOC129922560 n=1 Tax=Biomphalaria glabrata TaxID=6526 RepID=A0A9W2YQX6_BIOGL|nr:uncharacterized protein LOC129922560 [Biomphalaria glabrata]
MAAPIPLHADHSRMPPIRWIALEVVNKVPKKDILVVQGDWNAKVGSDSYQTWKGTCGKYSNLSTNERGRRLLEFAKYNNLLLANTLGCHKKSRITTWHSPNGEHHNQIDYIMVQQSFKTSIHTAKTRSFPGADIGSDHDLVMTTLKVHLKKVTKQGPTRIKFDLDKLKDPQVAAIFEAQVGGRFAALNILDSNDQDIDTQVNMLNTAVTDTALEILGKLRPPKKPWVTEDILQLCDKRRELKGKKLSDPKYVQEYKSVNKRIRKGMKEAKKKWIENKCQEIEQGLNRNNSKKAYQLVKDLTTSKHGRTNTIQDKNNKCLTEDKDVLKRWTEYCSELYNFEISGDPEILNVPTVSNIDDYPILRSEVAAAVKALKK